RHRPRDQQGCARGKHGQPLQIAANHRNQRLASGGEGLENCSEGLPAELFSSFVDRSFRRDIKSGSPSGVLSPEGPQPHFSATLQYWVAEIATLNFKMPRSCRPLISQILDFKFFRTFLPDIPKASHNTTSRVHPSR